MSKILNQLKINSDFVNLLKNNSDFNKLFWARTLSLIGTQMQRFGLPWLVYEISGSAALMAVNFTVSLLPGLLFGFTGGVIADRYDRKKIMFWGDLIAAVITFLYFMTYLFSISVGASGLFILTFILSSLAALYTPSFDAALPNIVEKKDIVNANSLFNVARSFISLGGPMVAGILIGFMGPWTNIMINAVSFLISSLLILAIKQQLNAIQINEKSSMRSDFNNSLSYIKNQTWLYYGLFITFGLFLATGSVGSLIQYYLLEVLNVKGFMFGFSFTLFEFIPMLLMGIYAPVLAKKYEYETLIFWGTLIFALSIVAMGATTVYAAVILSGMILNASAVLVLISWNTMIQVRVPNHMLGKISGVAITIQSVSLPIGGAISSLLVIYISAQWTLITFGLLAALISLSTLSTPFLKPAKNEENIKAG
ncbi:MULTISPECIES: MFS transporter [Exiguobacterium]|uniref:MFS transporter n=1 Tax=Exiguobacterium TaxID=33986 RepID=UPI001BA7E5D9|nr:MULTISPECIES: MFS transporter [Exiguobacterium]MCV9901315.1 MFS transporter [Exiguobacterium sp. N5]QUE87963.1 MFS transporter [Exiguobacterium alkaliphilum]